MPRRTVNSCWPRTGSLGAVFVKRPDCDTAGGGQAGEIAFDERSDGVGGEVADDHEGEISGVGEAFAENLQRLIPIHTFHGIQRKRLMPGVILKQRHLERILENGLGIVTPVFDSLPQPCQE